MILRFCVVIPAFNNPATLADVAKRALNSCSYPLLVVCDGSARPASELFREAGLADPRLSVLRKEENEGKGLALRLALTWCLARGFTHMITLDGDGQHFPEEIPVLADEALTHPFALVVGDRRMDSSAPGISHFGRRFSNFWVRYQAGTPVADSQSGFRAYPLFPLQTMRFFTRRYDFEIEVLVRALWRGVEVRSVPIRVLYQQGEERVSHFRKWRDNARISLLNTALVALSLCREHRAPLPAALAVGLGALIGCTPFFGLHTALAIAVAVAFRLNAPLLWLGTQISIPPLAPFLAMASLFLGGKLLGTGPGFLAWLLGSFVLGSLVGALAGLLTYRLARRWKGGKQRNWSGETRGGRFGNGLLIFVLRRFGLRAGYFCLEFVVPYFFLFAPRARQALAEYWRVAEPQLSWFARQQKIHAHLRSFARVQMDKIHQLHSPVPAFARRSSGFAPVAEALHAGRGILLAGAHAGNNDLAATSFQAHGLQQRIHVLQHEAEKLTLAKIAGEKSRELVDIIYTGAGGSSVHEVHQRLGEGALVGMMADRPLDNNFELVPFFGLLAPVATSPFRIALATGAELAFTFGFKGEGLSYDYFCVKPAPAFSENRELATLHYAKEYAATLESFLRRYPTQWFNLFRFFSARPTLPGGGLCEPRRNVTLEALLVLRGEKENRANTGAVFEAGLEAGP